MKDLLARWRRMTVNQKNELVAEKVMGITFKKGCQVDQCLSFCGFNCDVNPHQVENYCSDMSAAIKVAMKIKESFYQVEISFFKDDSASVVVWEDDITPAYTIDGGGFTVEECICLAGLMSVCVNWKETKEN